MGYWLHQLWKEDTGIDESVTSRYELPSKGILSSIKLRIEDKRHATPRTAVDVRSVLDDNITKLEVIANGSKVIKSITCNEALFSNLLDFKQPPWQQYSELASDYNIINPYLNFGRYLRDPLFGLDCSKYDLLELKITNTVPITAKTGFTDGSLNYEVWLEKYVGTLPGRIGYFKTSEKKSYTSSGGSAWDEVVLPCLNPYRRLFIRSWLTTKSIGAGISEVVFEVNEGEYTPFYGVPMDMCVDDIVLRGLDPSWDGKLYMPTTSGHYLTESPFGYPRLGQGLGTTVNEPQDTWLWGRTAGRLDLVHDGGVEAIAYTRMDGMGYKYCASIPFDIPDVESEYFPTADLSKVKLKWKETAQTPVISVVLDELVKE